MTDGSESEADVTPDSISTHWSHRLPPAMRPYAQLARLDRPVGYWLLCLPGWIGIAFAGLNVGLDWRHVWLGALILIGSIAMRGAGCTYNDIVDSDLDAQVERTRGRPLPAGLVSKRQAWAWLVVQCLIGLVILLLLPNRLSQIVALASLPLVAAYPFMKRIWGFPQVWLGLTFNWAVLVASAAALGSLGWPIIILYVGLAFWTLGYDTIYALQDIEDDAMVGIKSSAISFGANVRRGIAVAYLAAITCIGVVMYIGLNHRPYALFLALPFAAHLGWQVGRLERDDPAFALRLFKSNLWAGLLLFITILSYGIYISLTLMTQS